jgi:hypothetical protein
MLSELVLADSEWNHGGFGQSVDRVQGVRTDNEWTKLESGTESADIVVLLNQRKTIGLFESQTLNRRFTVVIQCKLNHYTIVA